MIGTVTGANGCRSCPGKEGLGLFDHVLRLFVRESPEIIQCILCQSILKYIFYAGLSNWLPVTELLFERSFVLIMFLFTRLFALFV